MDSDTLVLALELGIWTPTFSLASGVRDTDSHALVLGTQIPTLRCGPTSWG